MSRVPLDTPRGSLGRGASANKVCVHGNFLVKPVCEGVQDGMTSRHFQFGWYAPMEDMSLDIRRYLAATLGEDAIRPMPAPGDA